MTRTSPDGHEHVDNHPYLLSLPRPGVAPYRFVELDWNPGGHEPPGIYDTPHFDFHFYTVPPAERAAIVPSDPRFQEKADRLPPEHERPASYVVAAPPGAPAPAVPETRSPMSIVKVVNWRAKACCLMIAMPTFGAFAPR